MEVIHIVHRVIHRKKPKSSVAPRRTENFGGFPHNLTKFKKFRFGLQNNLLKKQLGSENTLRFFLCFLPLAKAVYL